MSNVRRLGDTWPNMSVLVTWYGLPGSGKSVQMRRLEEAGYRTFDDFMKNSIRRRSDFSSSRHFHQILNTVRASIPCGIADIKLCRNAFRSEMKEILMAHTPLLSLQWHCFDCRTAEAVAICKDNVCFRAEWTIRNSRHALDWIEQYASDFSIEPNAHVHTVVRARLTTASHWTPNRSLNPDAPSAALTHRPLDAG